MNGAVEEIAAADLDRVEGILLQASGISLSPALRRTLQVATVRAAAGQGLAFGDYLSRLFAGDPESIASLVEHSVIGETYFFRHPEQFAALRRRLALDFRNEPALRIWSAGCATGEEPYSLSMVLGDCGRARDGDRIIATDVSLKALTLARSAIYGGWSLRRLDPALRARHFEPRGEGVEVLERDRRRVEFRRHNLVLEAPLGEGFHAIFCRNVLIYFPPETVARVLAGLAGALLPGGLLVLGPVEIPLAMPLGLEQLDDDGAVLLRKPDPRRAPPAPPAPRSAPARPSPAPAPAVRPLSPPAPVRARPEPAPEPEPPSAPPGFLRAREAARSGRLDEAERLATESALGELAPESYLLLSQTAEHRNDLLAALDAVRRALYLDPALPTAHAAAVALYRKLGRGEEAERARRNALRTLDGITDATLLRGVEAISAGALRRALGMESGA